MSVTSASGGSPAAAASVDKERWIERIEGEFGAFGTVYYDNDGRVLGSMQYGPAPLFPRAQELPAGPPSRRGDPDHVRLRRRRVEPVGAPVALPRRDRRGPRPGRRVGRGVLVSLPGGRVCATSASSCHKTVFPADFLADFGFRVIRSSGRVGLAHLHLGGLQPVAEGRREKVLRVVAEAFLPEPVPEPRP